MAGGKLSARQKMINLMYLVFIAMLAMQMDKKVLTSIGLGIEENTEANIRLTEANGFSLSELSRLAIEQPEKYQGLSSSANQLSALSNEFNTFLGEVKSKISEDVEDKSNYEVMGTATAGDEYFFKNGILSEQGQNFLDKINKYREETLKLLGSDGDPEIIASINKRFNTSDDLINGSSVNWVISRFEGYPLISTLSNITRMQSGVKATESEVYGSLVAGQLKSDVSMTKYEAIVIPEKTAFFSGENFKGKVVLGKVDPTLKPNSVEINGRAVSDDNIQAGQVLLEFPAGSVGEKNILGKFVFTENGEPVEIPITSSYAVVSKPNSAVIAADKMNVVYRGLANPMTVSIPGIPDNKVSASGTGLRKGSGTGKYIMTPGSGREVKISATGTMTDGSKVSSSQTFRIKDIPKPLATVRKESGYVKMPKSSLVKTTVGVGLPDFLFDLKFNVNSFKLKAPGSATIVVSGSRMNSQAQAAINKARSGDVIAIFDVKSSIQGVTGISVKNASAVSVEIQ